MSLSFVGKFPARKEPKQKEKEAEIFQKWTPTGETPTDLQKVMKIKASSQPPSRTAPQNQRYDDTDITSGSETTLCINQSSTETSGDERGKNTRAGGKSSNE